MSFFENKAIFQVLTVDMISFQGLSCVVVYAANIAFRRTLIPSSSTIEIATLQKLTFLQRTSATLK